MSHDDERCLFDLQDLQTYHYYLEGNGCNNESLTIDNACIENLCETTSSPFIIRTGQNVTWTTDLNLTSGIIIEDRAQLTIFNCTIQLPDNQIIQVERGGKLTIKDAVITSSCLGSRWEHIEVNGDPDINQNSNNQGTLILENARIVNAKTGVLLDEEGLNGQSGGGILYANNSHFYNCKRGVSFVNYKSDNKSYIKNCRFTLDRNFVEPNNQQGLITMTGVSGIDIESCNFTDLRDVRQKSNGIFTTGADYNVSFSSFTSLHAAIATRLIGSRTRIEVLGNNFFSNNVAFSVDGFQGINASCNRIFNNNQYGLQVDRRNFNLNFRDNYWGSSTGPNHNQNTLGQGVQISNILPSSVYTPWTQFPYVSCRPKKPSKPLVTIKFYDSENKILVSIDEEVINSVQIISLDGILLEHFSGSGKILNQQLSKDYKTGIYIVRTHSPSGISAHKIFIP